MKNIPQPEELKNAKGAGSSDADALTGESTPVIPGTEEPRSMGDILREAEQAQATDATPEADASAKPKRVKKVSRSQSRRHARERALQALYQWDVSTAQSSDVRTQFIDEQDMSRVDVEYFTQLFNGVSHDPQTVDEAMKGSLDRDCLLYTSPSPRDKRQSRMPSSA